MTPESQNDGSEHSPDASDGLKNPADLFRFAMEGDHDSDTSNAGEQSLHQETGSSVFNLEDFKFISKIADGGMAKVFRAHQLSLDREVALKMMSGALAMNPDLMDRFHIESKAVGKLEHPNIVAVHHVDPDHDPPYYTMPLIEGGNLADWMRNERESESFESSDYLKMISILMEKVAHAVHYAHRRGIIHRDLKPGNILVDKEGNPHVTDFGLAKFIEQDSGLTQTNAVMGTPAYMAPEQAEGKNSEVSTGTDVFSLGTVLYELLTGVVPFFGETPTQTLNKVVQEDPIAPSKKCSWIPHDLEIICLKAMRKEVSDRYESALDLANDLQRWRDGYPIKARPPSVAYHLRRYVQRHRQGVITGSVAVLVILAISIVTWLDRTKQRDDDLISRLMSSNLESVPELLSEHGELSDYALKNLRTLRDTEDSDKQLRALLGLLPYDSISIETLERMVGSADPELLKSISDRYSACGMEASNWLQEKFDDPQTSISEKLRYAGMLAMQSSSLDFSESELEALAFELAAQPSPKMGEWIEVYYSIRGGLIPHLKHAFDKVQQSRALVNIAHLLSRFAIDDPDTLCELVLLAKPTQMDYLLESLVNATQDSLLPLETEAERFIPLEGNIEVRTAEITQQMRSVIALFELGFDEKLRSIFENWIPEDPRLRTAIIHGLSDYSVDSKKLISILARQESPGVVQGVLSALGDYDLSGLGIADREGLKHQLETYYRDAEQAGVRSMAEWLLRRWELADDKALAQLDADRDGPELKLKSGTWTLAPLGITMVTIPEPEPFLMGTTTNEFGYRPQEARHLRKIPRSFAIAAKPITFEMYGEFDPDYWVKYQKKDKRPGELAEPNIKLPIEWLSLDKMKSFCNWLSMVDGMEEKDWCYLKNDAGKAIEKENFHQLTGYRLPSEAEWEYACRAGSLTARFFGDDDALVYHYALYDRTSNERPYLVQAFRPNPLGLYGLYGCYNNVCGGFALNYPKETRGFPVIDDFGKSAIPRNYIVRGAMHRNPVSSLRSAARITVLTEHAIAIGNAASFRVAQTILQPLGNDSLRVNGTSKDKKTERIKNGNVSQFGR